MTRVFVYGTLKAGERNHHLMKDAKFITLTAAPGHLYAGISYPAAIPPEVALEVEVPPWICGEVYEVNEETLRRLDRLEGHPHFFERTEVTLWDKTKASMYYYKHDVSWMKSLPQGVWYGQN